MRFNIDHSLSNGKHLDWLVAPEGSTPLQVEIAVRAAAVKKFGASVFFNKWTTIVASNGYITVRMYA